MFDCDGDRREFAKNQYKNFIGRMEGGEDNKKQADEGKPPGEQQHFD
jgi:hypothetical protein